MILAGADPGFDGALAFLDAETNRVLGIVDVPTAKKKSGRRELLLHELVADCIQALDGRRCGHIWVEKVNGFAPGGRRMGASSAFSLGECFMAIRMLATCNGWPVTMIGPAQWKKSFGLGSDKAQARLRASELLPDDAHLWTPKRGRATLMQANGRAESVLLALYGLRSLQAITVSMERKGAMTETTNSAIGPTSAKTYYELQLEQTALERRIVARKTGTAPPPALQLNEVPRIPGYTWNSDRAPVPPIGEDKG